MRVGLVACIKNLADASQKAKQVEVTRSEVLSSKILPLPLSEMLLKMGKQSSSVLNPLFKSFFGELWFTGVVDVSF